MAVSVSRSYLDLDRAGSLVSGDDARRAILTISL